MEGLFCYHEVMSDKRNHERNTEPWSSKWQKAHGGSRSGGQSEGFIVNSIDELGQKAFVKTMRRPWDMGARKRFRREVASYETLKHAGIPDLIDHNSEFWEDAKVPLYLVIEYIEGKTLYDWIKVRGPMSLNGALEFGIRLTEIISYCHQEPILHRDLKPANVVLRKNSLKDPVIIDFGLAFNVGSEITDVSGFDEEIGNRFLRLPEAWRNRTPISDVTQAAGLVLYAMTGIEPHSLLDEEHNLPHRRGVIGKQLQALTQGRRQFSKLMVIFDRAFAYASNERYQTTIEFRQALISMTDQALEDEGDDMTTDFELYLNEQRGSNSKVEASSALLHQFILRVTYLANQLADKSALSLSQSSHVYDATTHLALSPRMQKPPPYVKFDFEMRGPQDVAMLIDGQPEWTGSDSGDDLLTDAVQTALMNSYLKHFRDASTSV